MLSESDQKRIDYGHHLLEYYLSDEKSFVKLIVNSVAVQWVVGDAVYGTLYRLKEVPPFSGIPHQVIEFQDVISVVKQWEPDVAGPKLTRLVRMLLCFEALAKRRHDYSSE